MSYLDDWYAVVARNVGGGSNKRFFHEGYGDMVAASKLYEHVIGTVTSGEATSGLRGLKWGELERSAPGVFSGCLGPGARLTPTFREASFESPAAAYLPTPSKQGKFLFVWKEATDGSPPPNPKRIAIHLPTTGDQYYWYRKQIALDLLKHDIASCILMFPYYGPRKPETQYAHVLPSVAAFITQIAAGVMESAGIAQWADTEFPNANVVFTGVSLGGSVASVGALVAAACIENGETCVGVAPIVATSSATSFLTGVLHNRIAWDVLEKAPGDCADTLTEVLREDTCDETVSEKVTLTKENGEPLNATETKLAATMECLSLPKIVRLMSSRRQALGHAPGPPKLGAVTQVSAVNDRFLGKHQGELFGTLRAACLGDENAEKREIAGGHISTLLPSKRGEVIVPAIVSVFTKLDLNQKHTVTRTSAPACAEEDV